MDAGGGVHELRMFFCCGAGATADNCSCVAHATAWRRGLSGDEADDGLAHVLLDEFGGLLLGVTADFADHDDGVRVGVVIEEPNGIEEGGPNDGIAADTDARGLADAELRPGWWTAS